MPERPDLRKIAGDIREALSSYPREALVDILTYVFQAYVVEGAPTVNPPSAERLAELEGLAFPELIQALQIRLEVPELALLEVQGGRVHVRLGGELHPIVMGADQRRAAQAPLPVAQSAAVAAQPMGTAAPAPVAAAVATPAAASPVARPAASEAPRPTRGVAVNPTPTPAAARPPAPVAAQSKPPADDPNDDDAASKRFRLLEID